MSIDRLNYEDTQAELMMLEKFMDSRVYEAFISNLDSRVTGLSQHALQPAQSLDEMISKNASLATIEGFKGAALLLPMYHKMLVDQSAKLVDADQQEQANG